MYIISASKMRMGIRCKQSLIIEKVLFKRTFYAVADMVSVRELAALLTAFARALAWIFFAAGCNTTL
jgi:hypothetical protein